MTCKTNINYTKTYSASERVGMYKLTGTVVISSEPQFKEFCSLKNV